MEDEIASLVASHRSGLICIAGSSGSGKTTALEHLEALFAGRAGISFLESRNPVELSTRAQHELVVYAADLPLDVNHLSFFQLAPWRDDEFIEYLLAVHKDSCGSVLARLTEEDRNLLAGIPELWVAALDGLAQDESCRNGLESLWRRIRPDIRHRASLQLVTAACVHLLLYRARTADIWSKVNFGLNKSAIRLLHHRAAQVGVVIHAIPKLLADERNLFSHAGTNLISHPVLALPCELIEMIGKQCKGNDSVLSRLHEVVTGPSEGQALAASLLHHAVSGWRPADGTVPVLRAPALQAPEWPDIQLSNGDLSRADLRRASLVRANLSKTQLRGANLSDASLVGAVLSECDATNGDFRRADLTGIKAQGSEFQGADLTKAWLDYADLQEAQFEGAKLTEASFCGANLRLALFIDNDLTDADFGKADFTTAVLSGLTLRQAHFEAANFTKANLSGCDLEDMDLTGCTFSGAILTSANLTGCVLRDVNLQQACLKNAGLAEIDAAGCNLRGADLRGASFHLGSTRSGRVGSPIACEGSRTGFYTDEYEEQGFKSPEEIRKANLCGADLRDAKIDGVDFYLVDLRGALYDPKQAEHFRRCGAILVSRV